MAQENSIALSPLQLAKVKEAAMDQAYLFCKLLGRLGSSDTRKDTRDILETELGEMFAGGSKIDVRTKKGTEWVDFEEQVKPYLKRINDKAEDKKYGHSLMQLDYISIDKIIRDTIIQVDGKEQHALYAVFRFYQHLVVTKNNTVETSNREVIVTETNKPKTITDNTYKHGIVYVIRQKKFGQPPLKALLGDITVDKVQIDIK